MCNTCCAPQGLGKTMQCSAYLAGLFASRLVKRVLIAAPKTLLLHWEKELAACGLGSRLHRFYGTSDAERRAAIGTVTGARGGILLTTYGMVLHNAEDLGEGADRYAEAGVWQGLVRLSAILVASCCCRQMMLLYMLKASQDGEPFPRPKFFGAGARAASLGTTCSWTRATRSKIPRCSWRSAWRRCRARCASSSAARPSRTTSWRCTRCTTFAARGCWATRATSRPTLSGPSSRVR